MAYSFAAISAADLAYLAADKPILGYQAIPVAPTVIWHNSGSTTDRTDPLQPARRAYDGFPGWPTVPTGVSADKTWYLSFDLGVYGVEFDFVALVNHNLGTNHSGGALTVTLEIDDASNFASAISIPVTVTTGASNTRLMALSLKHTGSDALRYSAVRYARLKITRGATNFTPSIGELIFGRRLQMYNKPTVPYDTYAKRDQSEKSETQGGIRYLYTYCKGKRLLSASWRIADATLMASISSWMASASYKSRGFVWIEAPYTAPNSWHLMTADDAAFDMPCDDNPVARNFALTAQEQGTETYYLATGSY